ALAALDPERYGPPGGTEHAAPRREALAGTLRGIGVPLHEWYGVQVFTDRLPDCDAGPAPEAVRERMLTAEEEAGRRDPYRQVAGLLHLFGVRD
ncbi:SAM-dependent methyltransferase, partial [Streptomyces sp. DJ]